MTKNERTTETNVALDMSGTSFGGGDSPLVRFGFPAGRRSGAAETAVAAHAPSGAAPAAQVPSLVVGVGLVGHHKTRHS